jgi:uncharacterized repeat protein (TIGR01451 family)
MKRHNKIVIILGALMILASLAWMAEPYYTWAQEQNNHPCRVALDPDETLFELENMNPGDETTKTVTVTKTGTSSANLYMTWDFISGTPTLGQEGSLFEQLILVISHNGNELYRGPMINGPQAGSPSQLTDALYIAFMKYGDQLELDFTIFLPGPETGNEFQGSTLITKVVFYTICSGEEDNTPAIHIEKYTNGVDADVPTGPFIPIGNQVTWTYVVTNPGRVPLSNVVVTDNRLGVNPVYISGDLNQDGILQVGESWLFRATGIAATGQYANIGTVVGTPPTGSNVTDSDPSHYYGIASDIPAINIEKATNGFDADLPSGPTIPVGNTVTWTYLVTNPGNVPLSSIVVTDNRPGVSPVYVSGDLNRDGILQVGEAWLFRATGVAVAGQYSNTGTVVGISPAGFPVSDADPSHYFGVSTPQEVIVDPDDPEISPEDPIIIIIPPEPPMVAPPLPRTDGVSMALLALGLLLLMSGLILKKSQGIEV